jgi:hypothetical protein
MSVPTLDDGRVIRLAVGLLGITTIALAGVSVNYFLEYLTAGEDSWSRLAIVPAVVALTGAICLGVATYLVWRDSRTGWLMGALLTVVFGLAWMDFGMGSPGMAVLFAVVPSFVIGGVVALTVVRFMRGMPPAKG